MTKGGKIALAITGCLVLTCAAGGIFISQWVDYPQASMELPRAMADAKVAGVPLTADELRPKNKVDKADNAATGFRTVLPEFDKDGSKHELAGLFDQLMSEKTTFDSAQRQISYDRGLLVQLRDISNKKVLDLGKDWDLGPEVLFPEFSQAKSAVKVLCASALIDSHEGRFADAANEMVAAKKLGSLCASEPCLISLLVQIAIDAIVYRTAENCLADASHSPAGMQVVRERVLSQEPYYDMRQAMKGEAYLGVSVSRNLDVFGIKRIAGDSNTELPPIDPKNLRRKGTPPGMMEKAYMTRALQFWTGCFRYMDSHKGDNKGLTEYMDRESVKLQSSKGISKALNMVLMPVFAQTGLVSLKGVADQRCKLALSSALEWRRAHGRFPDSLKEIGIALKDPFDGEPLRYRGDNTNGACRVWSIGQNGRDDDGVAMAEAQRGHTQDVDVVAAYPPVRSRPR